MQRKIRQNLMAYTLGAAWWIQLKFKIGCTPPQGSFAQ